MTLTYQPADGGAAQVMEVHDFKGPGVALGMHNTTRLDHGFARASFNYGLMRKLSGVPVHQEHHPESL